MTTGHEPEPEAPRLGTRAVHSGRRWGGRSLAPALFPSTTYVVDSVDEHAALAERARTSHYYSRFGSPTVQDFEEALADLEGAEAGLAFGSGMAALTAAVLGLCSAGDHVVVSQQMFSVSAMFFQAHCPRFGIDVTMVDGTSPEAVAAAVRPGRTQVVFLETPANPSMSLVDIEAVASIPGPFTVVDSTLATPVVQRPLEHGADLVVHAATKGLAGHNDALLGGMVGERDLIEAIWAWHAVAGGQASPFDAWNGLRGLRTLPVRMAQQSATAQELAEALVEHPAVSAVHYPGLADHPQRELAKRQMDLPGSLFSLELAGGEQAARRFCDSCGLAAIALSFGGPETLVNHPASVAGRLTPQERAQLGVSDAMVRVSVGLEDSHDLLVDFRSALDACSEGAQRP